MLKIIPLSIVLALMGSAAGFAADTQYTLKVDGMTCPFCVATSEKALKKIDGVNAVSTDLEAGIIKVCADEKVKFTDDQLKEMFLERGFTYRSMTKTQTCAHAAPAKHETKKAG